MSFQTPVGNNHVHQEWKNDNVYFGISEPYASQTNPQFAPESSNVAELAAIMEFAMGRCRKMYRKYNNENETLATGKAGRTESITCYPETEGDPRFTTTGSLQSRVEDKLRYIYEHPALIEAYSHEICQFCSTQSEIHTVTNLVLETLAPRNPEGHHNEPPRTNSRMAGTNNASSSNSEETVQELLSYYQGWKERNRPQIIKLEPREDVLATGEDHRETKRELSETKEGLFQSLPGTSNDVHTAQRRLPSSYQHTCEGLQEEAKYMGHY